MKEQLHELANEYVIKIEDKWVTEQWDRVERLKKRAEGSGTTVAWNEYGAASDSLDDELKRLDPSNEPGIEEDDTRPMYP